MLDLRADARDLVAAWRKANAAVAALKRDLRREKKPLFSGLKIASTRFFKHLIAKPRGQR